MKISNSTVSMSSGHAYEAHVSVQKATMQISPNGNVTNKLAAVYEGTGDSMAAAVEQSRKQEQRQQEEQRKAQELVNARQMLNNMPRSQWNACDIRDALRDIKETLLNKLLEALKGASGLDSLKLGELKKGQVLDLRSPAYRTADARAQLFHVGASEFPPAGVTSAGNVWRRVTAINAEYSEREQVAFQSQGYAVTEDGRSFHFDVGFSMSRSFSANYESLTSEEIMMTDPLIINLDGNAPSVSGAKFEFDLDGDGQRENISFAGDGNGFLALDANENGVIDDGSELFGTASGDGFADLAAYDGDGNGWIDENDAVYSKLRVWTRDADGHDNLLTLKEADVGAIYLGSAQTKFSLNDEETNETNAVVRKSGVYLRESGSAGTLSHVDLTC